MLFLMNTVVVATHRRPELPTELKALQPLPLAAVLSAGQALFARNPRLDRDRPDLRDGLSALISAKTPHANAVLFEPIRPEGAVLAYLADVSLTLLTRFWQAQSEGRLREEEIHRLVWSKIERRRAS